MQSQTLAYFSPSYLEQFSSVTIICLNYSEFYNDGWIGKIKTAISEVQ